MAPSVRAINLNASAQKIEVDNRFSVHYYYRIAETLLRQAQIYRVEKNHIDLYIILLRYSSLICETIPSHRDYNALSPKERMGLKMKVVDVITELETLKPMVQRQVDEHNKMISQSDSRDEVSYSSSTALKQTSKASYVDKSFPKKTIVQSKLPYSNSLQLDQQVKKISLGLPQPKEETLSRHSILGPNGLHSNWTAPSTGMKIQYPSGSDLAVPDTSSKKHDDLESILSLDDGTWSEKQWSLDTIATEESFSQLNIRQPSIPPVLAQVHPLPRPISPTKVADPRPGPANISMDGMPDSKGYKKLHIPVNMMESFLRLAEMNTKKNLETCGVLAGSMKKGIFFVTTLIIPKQESTSDSCQTTDEEEIFNLQDSRSLFTLGWIHTHPTQTCFMSSIDLHTHYAYQVMQQEAIAIVMAPTDTSRTHGIFHLSDPSGVSVIRNCQERGFHPHEEPLDGNPIYEHCSHVLMNAHMKFDVVDLRNK